MNDRGIITIEMLSRKERKPHLYAADSALIRLRSMIHIRTVLLTLRSMCMKNRFRQKDFLILKVPGTILKTRYLQIQRGVKSLKKFLKWILAGILTAGSIAMCVSAYGKFSDSVTVTNHISTGDINISMKELEKENGKEILYQNQKMVLPGDR